MGIYMDPLCKGDSPELEIPATVLSTDWIRTEDSSKSCTNSMALQMATFPQLVLLRLCLRDGKKSIFYGSTKGGGKGSRGVLYRITVNRESTSRVFEVVYDFPNQWQVSGRIPATTMIAINDDTYGLTLYGTTYQGGTYDSGTFFRMSGLDLPRINDLPFVPTSRLGNWRPTSAFRCPAKCIRPESRFIRV